MGDARTSPDGAEARLRHLGVEARARIVAAFSQATPPAEAEVRNDHCPECEETGERFVGLRWEEITQATLLSPSRVSPTFLTPVAFGYYLPGLMLRCIETPLELDLIPRQVIGRIAPPNGKVAASDASVFAALTGAQCEAVLAFLKVFALREQIESGAEEEALEYVPLTKMMARAMAYWGTRAGSAPAR